MHLVSSSSKLSVFILHRVQILDFRSAQVNLTIRVAFKTE